MDGNGILGNKLGSLVFAAIALAPVPCALLIAKWAGRTVARRTTVARETAAELTGALHEQLGSEAADRLAIGTGPYMLREWVPGQRLVLARNPNYQGTPKPTIDEAIYRVIPEAEARVTALLNGEADIIFGVAPQHLERIRASGRADVRGALEVRPGFIAMNPTYKPWDDKRMRLAVNYAIDREAIVNGVLAGEGKALYTPVGPNTMGYDPDVQPQYRYEEPRSDRYSQDGYYQPRYR